MGKIRVKALGIEELEKKQKNKAKKKAQEKKLVKGAKGGERIVAVGPSEEELQAVIASEAKQSQTEKIAASPTAPRNDKKAKQKNIKEKVRSESYQAVAKILDKTKKYSLADAIDLLEKLKRSKFDETVELHINTIQKGINITTTLPHGTGKKVRVAIANDQIIDDISKGKIGFDVLLAEPTMMPKLAKVARFLGPKGLMPNPKNGTITNSPKELAKKFEDGQTTFKTESKFPIMHVSVGKLSFGAEKLMANIQTVLNAVKLQNIKNATLKSSMSPGIKIQLG